MNMTTLQRPHRRRKTPTLAWLAVIALAVACGQDPVDDGSGSSDPTASEDVGPDVSEGLDLVEADMGGGPEDISAVGADIADLPTGLKLISIEPTQGKSSGGEAATLMGTGFDPTALVLFNGTPLDADAVVIVDDKEIQIVTPPHDPGLVTVEVRLPQDPPDPDIISELENAFLYYNDVLVAKVDPAEGPVGGGTPITITGTGFLGKTTVLVGGKPAIGVQVVADDEIIAVTPPGVFGSQPVHVINERGAAVLKKGFFYTDAPKVWTVQPAAGPTVGGTDATVLGSGFAPGIEIFIGKGQASVTDIISSGELRISTPPGEAGKADVTAVTKHGASVLPGAFVYTDDQGQASTKILSIAPPSGPVAGGQTITIVATGLVSKADTTVLFGNKLAKLLSVDPTAHTVLLKTPKGSKAGPVDVKLLTTKGSDTAKAGYDYSQTLQLFSIAPAFGPPDGNTKIVLKGSGFSMGSPTVKIGALPAATVVVVSDSELQAVTPAGSPGYVNVSVQIGDEKATLANGFAYTGKNLALHVVYPATGSQAGGTLVHVHGSGFSHKMQVLFAGKPATHFKFIDSAHITCKTPPGKVGGVDVSVQVGAGSKLLKNGYTYFNPMNKYGGTWGPEVDGTVNVTVLDAGNGQPVPDAFTMLWTDPTTPHQGFTDNNGQITFSGKDVMGMQMISASKPKYESASVVKFDATNVTLYINPIPDPSPGSPPPGIPLPKVSGKVVGLDKYVIIPAGKCYNYYNKPGYPKPICQYCSSDTMCQNAGGQAFACVDIGNGNGKRCVSDCSLGQKCPSGFFCQPSKTGGPRCVPQAGELTSVCYHTKQGFLSANNKPPVGPGFEALPANGYNYSVTTGFGEMAIVCFGGYKTVGATLDADDVNAMNAFTPTIMGVKRHLFVGPGENPTDVHIKLTIPLSKKASVRFDRPPQWPVAQGAYLINAAFAYMVFGSDGVIAMPRNAQKYMAPFKSQDFDKLELPYMPAAFTGEIYDASLTIMGLTVEFKPPNQIPFSASVIKDIKSMSNDAMIRRLGKGDFESIETGVTSTIHGMWGLSSGYIYAVGSQGALFHNAGSGWTQQAAFTDKDLRGVYGLDGQRVWVVGNSGTAARFDGMAWTELEKFAGSPIFNGVYAAEGKGPGDEQVWVAGSSGIYKVVTQGGKLGVKKYYPSPYLNAWAIHGSDKDHIWAVGYQGKIVHWNGKVWSNQQSSTAIGLRGVWAAGPKSVYAVGEAGQILRYNGVKWTQMKSPVTSTLHDVWGWSDKDVWAVGTEAVVLHYDGTSWKRIKIKEQHKALLAMYSTKSGDFFSMGEQELLIGPMLYPPLSDTPKENGKLDGYTIKWTVDPETTQPHFNSVTIGIPGMGPDTPVWNIMTAGDLSQVVLPDFPSIQGTPGIPKGKMMRLTMIRGYMEGFDIDSYDNADLNTYKWQSWAMNQLFFTK